MSKDLSREIVTKLIYYLVVAKSSGRDYKYFKPKIIIIIIIYYTRELAPLWIAYSEVKVLKKVKNLKKVRKEKRSPVRGHELGRLFSLSPEKEDKGDRRIT